MLFSATRCRVCGRPYTGSDQKGKGRTFGLCGNVRKRWHTGSVATDPFAVEQRPPFWRRRSGSLLAGAAALAAKGKALLLLAPKLKLLTTSGTMLVSVAAYSLIWGWTFAVGFVLLLLVHELGHVIQLRREGIPASAPFFIPFLGAVVSAKSLGDDAVAEARVGLAGPVLGSLGALACLGVY